MLVSGQNSDGKIILIRRLDGWRSTHRGKLREGGSGGAGGREGMGKLKGQCHGHARRVEMMGDG